MICNSLKNLLISPRNPSDIIAFNDQVQSTWLQFTEQVSGLSEDLTKSSALRWALCCEDSYQFAVGLFALAYAGKEIILPGNHQPEMLKQLADHFDGFLSDGLQLEDNSKVLKKLPFTGAFSSLISQPLEMNTTQLVLFTSGSSGDPKAIRKSFALLDAEIQSLELQFGELIAHSQVLSTVSHQHIYGLLFRVLWPLLASRPFQSIDLVYPEQLALYAQTDYTLVSSPALLKRLTNSTQAAGYKAIFSSGGPLSYEAVKDTAKKLKHLPIEVFGSTETGGIGFRQQLSELQPWVFFNGLEVALNQQNCLKIKSPWIDCHAFYQTNDQCELLGNQQFILKGRVDRIVKIEEKRVSLNEVEQKLNALQWVNESAVLLVDETHRISLAAVITLNQQGEMKLQELGKGRFWMLLRQQLRRWIEPVALPRHFRVVNEIKLNKQGKRSHSELSALFNKSGK